MSGTVHIRDYTSADREAVRSLCCDTGYLGKPIDPVFEDRELFADYLTSYYTDVEPEAAVIMEVDGVVKGYLLGSRRPFRQKVHDLLLAPGLALRILLRYGAYKKSTKEFIWWILRNSWREVPATPKHMAHFHFNVYPEAKGLRQTTQMLNRYLDFLRRHGEKAVFGQMVTFESKRSAKTLERFGFRLVERREITKWRGKHPEPVYLTTVVRHLTD